MLNQKITASSDNILYLDFDGTITGASGSVIFQTNLCNKLHYANTVSTRGAYKKMYDDSEQKVKVTHDAKEFLSRMNGLYPYVKIVIITRNWENYIRGLLEFEGIDTSNITIYPRGEGLLNGPGQNKRKAVLNHEQHCQPGLRLICDDTKTDMEEMYWGAKNANNTIIAHHKAPGAFAWLDYSKDIFSLIRHILPVNEYLHGKISNRFHLFSANVHSIAYTSEKNIGFKAMYHPLQGDDLKRAILNDLKSKISEIISQGDLASFKQTYLSSPEYKVLAKGQGFTTRLFGLETDSQRAVALIFANHEKKLSVTESVPTKVLDKDIMPEHRIFL